MLDAIDLLNTIKKAAIDAVNSTQPSDFYFGKVTSVKPLKIFVEQKMTLGNAHLVLTETISKSIKTGDEVILLKKKGGQKYLVLDRLGVKT